MSFRDTPFRTASTPACLCCAYLSSSIGLLFWIWLQASALARVMGSAYYEPRLSPRFDVEQDLAASGYIDRHHMRASELAARKHLPLTPELERFESRLDKLEHSTDTVTGFLERFPAP